MKKETREKGSIIVKEGDEENSWFYVVFSGKVQFIENGMVRDSDGSRGCTIGEMALMYHTPQACSATVTSEKATLFKIHKKSFRGVLSKEAHHKAQTFKELVHQIPIFKNLRSTQISKLSEQVKQEYYDAGQTIVKKGDVGDRFYIVKEGVVLQHDIELGRSSKYSDQTLKPGDWFGRWVKQKLKNGELHDHDDEQQEANNGSAVSEADYTAGTEVQLLVMDRQAFEKSIGNMDKLLHQLMKIQLLREFPIFAASDLTDAEYEELTSDMEKRDYKFGHIFKYKDPQKRGLWIIRSGNVKYHEVTEDGEEKIHMLKQGDYFGDKWINYDDETLQNCKETVECITDTKCYIIRREELEIVIKDLSRLGAAVAHTEDEFCKDNLHLEDLEKRDFLGKGQFGTVWLAARKSEKLAGKTIQIFALKVIHKLKLLEHTGGEDMIVNVMREKKIMAMLNYPFFPRLYATFQDEYKLYKLLSFVQGGELFGRIYLLEGEHGVDMDEAIFYSSCILEALNYMHEKNICYRDLQPENVLIDKEGYACLVGFVHAKVVVDKTYTLCGTPEYLAPEVLISQGHNSAADYWSFGALIFEMIAGVSPFFWEGVTQPEMARAILTADFSFGDSQNGRCESKFNDNAKDLITKLLVANPSERLGNLAHGAKDVMCHPFFESIDFKKLVKKEIFPPWIPEIKDCLDAHNFGETPDQVEEEGEYRTLSPKEQQLFENF